MDQKQIEEIVRSVMASMGQTAPAPSEAKCATTTCAAPVTSESCALDLGSAEAKRGLVLKPASRRRINRTASQHRGPRLYRSPVRVRVRRRCCVSSADHVRKIPY